ncbi:hypothetical protein [Sphingomonas sp. LHG3406-1]|uniref:hypothetical protein n=1 Tax=Sphingomonas sp. LHG3406-1 TaxID=2804617 RepID=UPI00263575E5|nr:hypothetical protein [Sphingomonas sp. LHG3406-1]
MATMAYENGGDGTVSVGRIFSRAFSFIIGRPGIALGSAVLFGALPSLLNQALTYATLADPENLTQSAAVGYMGLQFFSLFITLVFSALMQAIITRGLVIEHEGGSPSLGRCMADGLRFAIPIVLLTILWWLAISLGMLLLIVPGVILACMWAVSIPALVEERTGVIGAFGRSRELTKGHRWKVFGLLAVVIISLYLIMAVLAVIGISTASEGALANDEGVAITVLIATALSGFIFSLLWSTIQPSLFVELRDAKEGGSAGDLQQVFS